MNTRTEKKTIYINDFKLNSQKITQNLKMMVGKECWKGMRFFFCTSSWITAAALIVQLYYSYVTPAALALNFIQEKAKWKSGELELA